MSDMYDHFREAEPPPMTMPARSQRRPQTTIAVSLNKKNGTVYLSRPLRKLLGLKTEVAVHLSEKGFLLEPVNVDTPLRRRYKLVENGVVFCRPLVDLAFSKMKESKPGKISRFEAEETDASKSVAYWLWSAGGGNDNDGRDDEAGPSASGVAETGGRAAFPAAGPADVEVED